jgi:hypothetical protein
MRMDMLLKYVYHSDRIANNILSHTYAADLHQALTYWVVTLGIVLSYSSKSIRAAAGPYYQNNRHVRCPAKQVLAAQQPYYRQIPH